MNRPPFPLSLFRRSPRKALGWDAFLPVTGLVLLFLEVSPRPLFGFDLESARILLQFPLVAFVFLAAWEHRFVPALALASALGILQAWPGIQTLLHDGFRMDALFPATAWALLLLGYLHPARREVYLEELNAKEQTP